MDNIYCILKAEERNCNTKVIFYKDKYNQDRYDEWLRDMKVNINTYKVVRIDENGIEEVLYEK